MVAGEDGGSIQRRGGEVAERRKKTGNRGMKAKEEIKRERVRALKANKPDNYLQLKKLTGFTWA